MNIWDILILAAVAAMLFFAFRTARGRSGESGCGCGCEGCRKSCGDIRSDGGIKPVLRAVLSLQEKNEKGLRP